MAVASGPPRSRPVKRSATPARSATAKPMPAKPMPAKPMPAKPRPASPVKGAPAKPTPAKGTQALAHGGAPARGTRPARGSLSRTSAQRFSARIRARRRRRGLVAVLVLLALAGAGWAALRSPWATVQRIEVTGTDRIPAATVRAEAISEVGHPMLTARTADVAARVRAQRLVRSVQVRRHWPGTLVVEVVEREPVAAVPSGSRLALVDPDGVVIQTVDRARRPAGLPLIQVNPAVAGTAALTGCLAVLHGLPPDLARRLDSIGADSLDGIWLKLTDGARVEWGSSTDSARKAQVLRALLPQHAVDYDVRSPDTPAVRGK